MESLLGPGREVVGEAVPLGMEAPICKQFLMVEQPAEQE
jgi:hypothetical protein